MRSGQLSPEEADVHPQRSVITRALGTDPDVDVDTFEVEAQPGRRVPDLLGRPDLDGRRRVDPRRRRAQPVDLDRAARALVDAANKGGGEDNITVIVFELGDDGAEEAPTLATVAGTPRTTTSAR